MKHYTAYHLVIFIVACFVLLRGASPIRSWDIWWHLKTAQLSIERKSTLPTDPFSLTMQAKPWRYKDLGADYILYGFYSLNPKYGLAIFKLMISCLFFLMLWSLVKDSSLPLFLKLAISGLAFTVSAFRIIVRPSSFSLIFFPLGIFVILKILKNNRTSQNSPHPKGAGFHLPIIWICCMLIWANLHRSVLTGIVLLFISLLSSLLAKAKNTTKVARITIALIASTAITFLTPNSYHLWSQSLKVFAGKMPVEMVSEWQKTTPALIINTFPLYGFYLTVSILALIIIFYTIVKNEKEKTAENLFALLTGVTFILLSVRAVRMIPLMAIATIPVILKAIEALSSLKTESFFKKITPALDGYISIAVSLIILLINMGEMKFRLPHPGFEKNWYPEGAIRFMEKAGIKEEGYTSFEFAGYLIFWQWPQKHVICDGRFDTLYSPELMADCLQAGKNQAVFESLKSRFNLKWALIRNRAIRAGGKLHPISAQFLDNDPKYHLVYWDSASLLYVVEMEKYRRIIEKYKFRFLKPHNLIGSIVDSLRKHRQNPQIVSQIEYEVGRLVKSMKDDYRPYCALAVFIKFSGLKRPKQFSYAIQLLTSSIEEDPQAIKAVLKIVGL